MIVGSFAVVDRSFPISMLFNKLYFKKYEKN